MNRTASSYCRCHRFHSIPQHIRIRVVYGFVPFGRNYFLNDAPDHLVLDVNPEHDRESDSDSEVPDDDESIEAKPATSRTNAVQKSTKPGSKRKSNSFRDAMSEDDDSSGSPAKKQKSPSKQWSSDLEESEPEESDVEFDSSEDFVATKFKKNSLRKITEPVSKRKPPRDNSKAMRDESRIKRNSDLDESSPEESEVEFASSDDEDFIAVKPKKKPVPKRMPSSSPKEEGRTSTSMRDSAPKRKPVLKESSSKSNISVKMSRTNPPKRAPVRKKVASKHKLGGNAIGVTKKASRKKAFGKSNTGKMSISLGISPTFSSKATRDVLIDTEEKPRKNVESSKRSSCYFSSSDSDELDF